MILKFYLIINILILRYGIFAFSISGCMFFTSFIYKVNSLCTVLSYKYFRCPESSVSSSNSHADTEIVERIEGIFRAILRVLAFIRFYSNISLKHLLSSHVTSFLIHSFHLFFILLMIGWISEMCKSHDQLDADWEALWIFLGSLKLRLDKGRIDREWYNLSWRLKYGGTYIFTYLS